jgi:nicotinamide mononucleotide transporter PnuC
MVDALRLSTLPCFFGAIVGWGPITSLTRKIAAPTRESAASASDPQQCHLQGRIAVRAGEVGLGRDPFHLAQGTACLGSAALQLVFITAAVFGWFGWSASGAKPSRLTNLHRLAIAGTILLLSLVIAPLLADIGAAAAYPDTLLLLGSMAAQVLMVLQKYETWVLWFLVNIGYVALYATQDLLFTTVLYVVFTVMAVVGWKAWYESHRSALRSH